MYNLLKIFRNSLQSSSYFSIFDFCNKVKSLKKGATLKTSNTFSLSIQKNIGKNIESMDFEIGRAFQELNFKSMMNRSGINKTKGFKAVSVLLLYAILPFLKIKSSGLHKKGNGKKDVYYRFLNHERFNWRKLVYLLATKIIGLCGDVPLREKVLIADDTIVSKTGKNMECVSYHYDHKTNRSILGHQYLQLGYHNGINLFPLDMVANTSSKRPNDKMRDIDKRTSGWRRRKEALGKKTDSLSQMIRQAWNNGIDASFVLFDSWFAHDSVISNIVGIGYGVICRLKKSRVRYEYGGKRYTLNRLWRNFVRKRMKAIDGGLVKAACLDVKLPKSGDVRLVFILDRNKQWNVLLSTDTDLSASDILNYYARRWAIEVFFKDAKQMLYLGKEQSRIFDATIASYSIVMIRYLLLVYILNKRRLVGPLGPLFRELSEEHMLLDIAKQTWIGIRENIIKSSYILSYKIELEVLLQLLDLSEDLILNQTKILCAKL